ncbi:MAG: hypothetical protein KDJ76_05210 [Xanthobacteraceae bacterium]|nr:hypothetical protein [Xanthobacteraceae bacterium]
MRFGRVSALLCAFSAISVGLATFPAHAGTEYDGLWNVTIVTNSGSCEKRSQYPLTVTNGKITAPGAEVSGRVGPAGLVKVSIQGAYANGQLNGKVGSGKWNGASGGIPCSGRWEASRQ